MSGIAYWNPTTDLNKSGGLENLEWPGHVRAGGRTCSKMVTGTRSGDRICPVFSDKLECKVFSTIALHQLTQYIPIDSTELMGHK
jgi:hypothetical protein